jgi:hypothetical protein
MEKSAKLQGQKQTKTRLSRRNRRDRKKGGKDGKPKKIYREKLVMDVPTREVSVTSLSSMKVDADFDPQAFKQFFVDLYSYMCTTEIPNAYQLSVGSVNVYTIFANAICYLYEECAKTITTTALTPSRVPRVVNALTAALVGKQVRVRSGATISYGWKPFVLPSFDSFSFAGSNSTFVFTEPIPAPTSTNFANVITPTASEDDYNSVITMLEKSKSSMLQVVTHDHKKSTYATSVSAFARNYVYNGAQVMGGFTNGMYKDLELEVPIFHPGLAQFGIYGADTRAPRYLSPGSGSAGDVLGRFLHGPKINQSSPPVVYKFIDFRNIQDAVCLWAALAKEAMYSAVDGGYVSTPEATPFTFSLQDFKVVLRQAVMAALGEAYWTQFVTPLEPSSSNVFVPYISTATTYGSPEFLKLKLPQLIVENINALKARVIAASGKGKYALLYVPVLGDYINDRDPLYQYQAMKTPVDEVTPNIVPQDLFAPATFDIRLQDGLTSGGYVCMNSVYFMGIMNDWNVFCDVANNVSTPITSLGGDAGPPGFAAITMTRDINSPSLANPVLVDETALKLDARFQKRASQIKQIQLSSNATAPPLRPVKAARYCKNYQKSVKSQGAVGDIPPATSTELSEITLFSVAPLTQTIQQFSETLILPMIRFDPEGLQTLTPAKYQTETYEYNSISLQQIGTTAGITKGQASMFQVMRNLAGLCIRGRGGENTVYAETIAHLSNEGHAGILSSILGGFVKTILPADAHGVVDAVADMIPI